ncbi:hypothetical protein [uncultured Rothia sp.]|uniref:hypothetical protein n=1 Tax=uncultured Rothia sp. TaxID=316088 RepID=UPI002618A0FF|nr:hypothetical protein [uncultured Rothia sp.]
MLRKFLAETVTNGSIGLNRPKGYIPLGQRQKKPLLAVLAADSSVLLVCILFPLNFRAESPIDYIPAYIFMNIIGSVFWFFAIHTNSFYIQQNETSVKWRNWRFKTREFDYSSITKIHMQVNGKGGHLLISSSQMGRYRLGFSPVFFDATYIYHMILFRERYGVWPPKYIPELFVEFGDYEDMDALIKVICYARTYEIGSPEAGEYRQIPEHLQRILDRAAAESK